MLAGEATDADPMDSWWLELLLVTRNRRLELSEKNQKGS